MLDSFDDQLPPGTVIGSPVASGGTRLGRDAERLLSIDNGALRIAPPALPGWGRHGIAYGPFEARAGLGFAVRLLNGHNNSQSNRDDRPLHRKAARLLKRLVLQLIASHKAPPRPPNHPDPQIQDNLAVGWYSSESPTDPVRDGPGFVVTAARGENAVLSVGHGARRLPVLRGLQNLQICYFVLLREEGAAYYVASVSGAEGCATYPLMRPLAIDPHPIGARPLFPGVHQSVLGEGGFLIDSRVYRASVGTVPDLVAWHGTAHAADRLAGSEGLDRRQAEIGGTWSVESSAFGFTTGAATPVRRSLAYLDPGSPSGLISASITMAEPGDDVGIAWRILDANRFWCALLDPSTTRVFLVADREWTEIARVRTPAGDPQRHLQLLDDGRNMQLSLDGAPLFDEPVVDGRYRDATCVGLISAAGGSGIAIRDFEAHPREIGVPAELDPGEVWDPAAGAVLVHDDFAGPAAELDGCTTTTGAAEWRRLFGRGRFDRTGDHEARVRATPERPNPGRTAYGVDWSDHDFADLSAELILPGSDRGEDVTGRPGFVFFQDPENYLIVNVWNADRYEGGAVSAFFRLGGRERLDRSVWTNVADRFTWGVPFRFRVSCDGMNLLAYVNGEPVLYRALTDAYPTARRLRIRKVGLVANWEYGDDMGSRFRDFQASGRPQLSQGDEGPRRIQSWDSAGGSSSSEAGAPDIPSSEDRSR